MLRRALLLLLLSCTACAGSLQRDRQNVPAAFALALPAPSELRAAAFIPGERSLDASQYETALPSSRITVSGSSLKFLALPQPLQLADLAYAYYALDISGYAGVGTLGVDWQGGAPAHGVWLGLANWADGRWDWQPVPVSEEIDLGLYGDYVSGVDGRMVVVILSTRDISLTLDRVYFGTPGLEPPVNLQASDGTFTDKVQLTWDPPASGPAPGGYGIWRSDAENGSYFEIGNSAAASYDDTTAVLDATYWYKVKSTKGGEPDSSFSTADSGFATAGGAGWTIVTAGTFSGQEPQHLSLALVNSHPAIVWNRTAASYPVNYTRAQDTAGATWGGGVETVSTTRVEPCLGYIGGRPGISFQGPMGSGDLYYVHGADANGSSFSPETLVLNPPSGTVVADPDLLEVGGRPAIAFRYSDLAGGTGTELCYMRANDALGDSWPAARVVVDSGEKAWNPQLVILAGGNPAIAYSETDLSGVDKAKLMFVRATNATGSAWQPPVQIFELGGVNTLVQLNILIASGIPAVVFNEGGNLYYKRANDALGGAWPAGATTIASGVEDFYDGAVTVNGKPAAAYIQTAGTDFKLMYLQAIDDAGNSWFPAEAVETTPDALDIATLQAFGSPQHACIAYRVIPGEIRFARKN